MHERFIHRCIELARKAQGNTGTNPMVGAVLVREGKIIAEGFHQEFGKPHAERQLLQKYEYKIRSTDTLYVNLEPCCHTNKKTPPCAQMLIEKGVKNVVIGMKDPNPAVAGKGTRLLRSSGVNVSICTGLTADCLRLNRGYVSLQTKGHPWVTLKQAQTVDHRIAKADGSPLNITTRKQNEWSHRFLRARHDAVLVGIGTVLKDDPQLNVRGMQLPPPMWRIILDPSVRIPLDAKVVSAPLALKTIVVTALGQEQKKKNLQKRGVRVVEVQEKKGLFDWSELWKALMTPEGDFYGITSILVEGGPKTWEIFRKAKVVDEEVGFIG